MCLTLFSPLTSAAAAFYPPLLVRPIGSPSAGGRTENLGVVGRAPRFTGALMINSFKLLDAMAA